MKIMNMQNLMREAQKMQAQLQKTQKELEQTTYEGNSSLVKVVINGKHEVQSVKFNLDSDFAMDDMEMLEDIVIVAINDAVKKASNDKEAKLSKYGSGLTGLM